MTGLVVTLAACLAASPEEGSPLGLADLAAYRAALAESPDRPAVAVRFRDLWDHAEAYRGRRVQVEGRVARRFRQGAVGAFPPLVELWVTSPEGDPFCLVYPTESRGGDVAPGASIRFRGTYLKRLRYRGGDVDRLAPLIAGGRSPVVVELTPARGQGPTSSRSALDWVVGLVVASFAALILLAQHLRRPARLVRDYGSPPVFEGDDSPSRNGDAAG